MGPCMDACAYRQRTDETKADEKMDIVRYQLLVDLRKAGKPASNESASRCTSWNGKADESGCSRAVLEGSADSPVAACCSMERAITASKLS